MAHWAPHCNLSRLPPQLVAVGVPGLRFTDMSDADFWAALDVQWVGLSTASTKAGKSKPVATAIPGQWFWRRWRKTAGFKQALSRHGFTLRKLAPRQWELVCWLNKHNEPVLAERVPGLFANPF